MAEYTITLTIMDAKGQKSRHTFYLAPDIDTSIGLAQDYARLYAQQLDGAIKGAIVGLNVATNTELPTGIKAAPLENSDVEEGRDFYYRTENGFGFRHRVPTFDESLIEEKVQVGFGTLPDEAELFVYVLTNPQDLTPEFNVTPSDSRNDRIVGYDKSIETFKKSRK